MKQSSVYSIRVISKIALILPLVLLILSCSASKQNPNFMKDAEGRIITTSKRAEIVFVRSPALAYNDPIIVRTTDEKLRFVGSLPQNSKISHIVTEGKHTFMILGENMESMQARVKAGHTYYVVVSPKFGVYKNRVSMVPVSDKDLELPEIQNIIKGAHYYQPDIKGYKWLEENVNRVHSYSRQAKVTSTILPNYGVDKPIDPFTVKHNKRKTNATPKKDIPDDNVSDDANFDSFDSINHSANPDTPNSIDDSTVEGGSIIEQLMNESITHLDANTD